MLHRHINQFLDYCSLVDFSIRSIQALTSRLNEFDIFLKTQRIRSVKKVRYRHLIVFAADFNAPSIHITKSRVWALRQFHHFFPPHGQVFILHTMPKSVNNEDATPLPLLPYTGTFRDA
jgi:site-specific recombinase XerD